MTINIADNSPRVSYAVAAGVTQTSFTVSFEFFDNEDLNVYVDSVLKTLTSDYTVSGGDGSTGTVVMSVTGAASGSVVVVTRDIGLERTTDFPASGAFNIATLNTELDRIIAITADLNDRTARSIGAEDSDATVSYTLPSVDVRKGTVLAFNATSGDVEVGPQIANVQSLANVSADIALLADIQDGTTATNAITNLSTVYTHVATLGPIASNITTVAGVSTNVATVAGISGNVSTVAGDSANIQILGPISGDITTVGAVASNVTTVATNINSVNTVATNISSVVAVANDLLEVVSEIETVANDLNEATSEIDVVANNIANVNAVGAVSADVSTVAGIASDVTSVVSISSNIQTIANSAATTNINTVAADLSGSNNIGTVAGDITNINTVGGSIANVNVVAAGISGINTFANQYEVSASTPSSPNEGLLWFDTSTDTMKVYNGNSFQNAGSSVNGTSIRGSFTATAGQTSFATAGYDSGFIDIYLNGVKQIVGTDVTATDGTNFVFASGLAAGDVTEYVAYGTFELASVYNQTQSDARYAILGADVDFGSNKILYSNVYSATGDLPSASTYHGMFAHVHGTGAGYFAHAGNWMKLVNEDTSGNVVISGNLTVSGTQTTVNSTTLDVADLNITVANGAADAAAANGAGLTVDGASATFNYASTGDKWTMNKPLDVSGTVNATSFTGDGSGLTGVGFTTNVVTASTTATKDNHYYLNGATLTLTLPASPTVGDEVRLSEVAGNTDCIVGRNGSNIMGDASDLTIDSAYLVLSLRYVDATIGWAFS